MAFVAVIWILERQPPALGETAELHEARPEGSRPGRDLLLVVVGLAALAVGSMALVEGVRRLSGYRVDPDPARVGGRWVRDRVRTGGAGVVGRSAGRRGMTDAVVAGAVGSYAYNVTTSLGAGAVIAPIFTARPDAIRLPYLAMAP